MTMLNDNEQPEATDNHLDRMLHGLREGAAYRKEMFRTSNYQFGLRHGMETGIANVEEATGQGTDYSDDQTIGRSEGRAEGYPAGRRAGRAAGREVGSSAGRTAGNDAGEVNERVAMLVALLAANGVHLHSDVVEWLKVRPLAELPSVEIAAAAESPAEFWRNSGIQVGQQ